MPPVLEVGDLRSKYFLDTSEMDDAVREVDKLIKDVIKSVEKVGDQSDETVRGMTRLFNDLANQMKGVNKVAEESAGAIATLFRRLQDPRNAGQIPEIYNKIAEAGARLIQSAPAVAEGNSAVAKALSGVGTAAATVFRGIIPLTAAIVGANVVLKTFGSTVSQIEQGIFGFNAAVETAGVQLTALTGSASAALRQVEELRDFATSSPFSFPEVVQAAKQLQMFGISTDEVMSKLTMLGDTAAASGQSLSTVAMMYGRAVDMLKAGEPLGRTAYMLQRMGLLSTEARARLEALGKSAAPVEEQLAALDAVFLRFGGTMDKMKGTFSGLIQSFAQALTINLAEFGRPFFEFFKELAGVSVAWLEDPKTKQAFQEWGQAAFGVFKEITLTLADAADTWVSIITAVTTEVKRLFGFLHDVIAAWDKLKGAAGGVEETLLGTFAPGVAGAKKTLEARQTQATAVGEIAFGTTALQQGLAPDVARTMLQRGLRPDNAPAQQSFGERARRTFTAIEGRLGQAPGGGAAAPPPQPAGIPQGVASQQMKVLQEQTQLVTALRQSELQLAEVRAQAVESAIGNEQKLNEVRAQGIQQAITGEASVKAARLDAVGASQDAEAVLAQARHQSAVAGVAAEEQRLALARTGSTEALQAENATYALKSQNIQAEIDSLTQQLAIQSQVANSEREQAQLRNAIAVKTNEQMGLESQHQAKVQSINTDLTVQDTQLGRLVGKLQELNALEAARNEKIRLATQLRMAELQAQEMALRASTQAGTIQTGAAIQGSRTRIAVAGMQTRAQGTQLEAENRADALRRQGQTRLAETVLIKARVQGGEDALKQERLLVDMRIKGATAGLAADRTRYDALKAGNTQMIAVLQDQLRAQERAGASAEVIQGTKNKILQLETQITAAGQEQVQKAAEVDALVAEQTEGLKQAEQSQANLVELAARQVEITQQLPDIFAEGRARAAEMAAAMNAFQAAAAQANLTLGDLNDRAALIRKRLSGGLGGVDFGDAPWARQLQDLERQIKGASGSQLVGLVEQREALLQAHQDEINALQVQQQLRDAAHQAYEQRQQMLAELKAIKEASIDVVRGLISMAHSIMVQSLSTPSPAGQPMKPSAQHGGIVDVPVQETILHGGEMVLPKDISERIQHMVDNEGGGGGTVNVAIHNPVLTSRDSVEETADQVARIIRRRGW